MRKKITVVFLLFSILIFVTSCNLLSKLTNNEGEQIEAMSEEIIRCLTENDQAGFAELFCEKIKGTEGFDRQIEEVFSFFKCDSYLRSEIKTTAGGGGLTEFGQKTEWYVTPEITYIEVLIVPDGAPEQMYSRYYRVEYYYQMIDKNHPELEGLHGFEIELINLEDHVTIGTWPAR